MPNLKDPLAASIIVCESVLAETSGVLSAIRIFTLLRIAPSSNIAYFNTLTLLSSRPGDIDIHSLTVRLVGEGEKTGDWKTVASAPDHEFAYGYKIDRGAPGVFTLTTQFSIDVSSLNLSTTFFVQAVLDGSRVAQAPIMLRR